MGVAFDQHPAGEGLHWRTDVFYMETDAVWREIDPGILMFGIIHDMKNSILRIFLLAPVAACAFAAGAASLSVDMLPGERWWGVCNSFGTNMPCTGGT